MKKALGFISIFLSICICFGTTSAAFAAYEPPFTVYAKSIYMLNLDSGRVVYEKNADEKNVPASLTKIMTSLLLMEKVPDLETAVATAPAYIYKEFAGINVSTADIRQGEEVSALQLLYSMMLPSANEGASITADYLGEGSIENFTALMNQRALELGCTDTNFVNAHGLYKENHYSTAKDIAKITLEALKYPIFNDVVTSTTYEMPPSNKHKAARTIFTTATTQITSSPYYREYIKGVKTGSLPEAGHNYVSTAVHNGERYLLVVMGAAEGVDAGGEALSKKPAFDITADIYEWVFANFAVKPATVVGEPISEIKLLFCKEKDTLLLYPVEELLTFLPNDFDDSLLKKEYLLPTNIAAPVAADTIVGTVTLILDDEILGTVQLKTTEDIQRDDFLYYLAKVQDALTSIYVKLAIALVLCLFAGYIFYIYIAFRRHKRRKRLEKTLRKR